MTSTRLARILASVDPVVTVTNARGGYGATAEVVGPHERGLRVRVVHANPGASICVGDELAIPDERVGMWTSK